MAAILTKCSIRSLLSSNKIQSTSKGNTSAVNHSSKAYYPQSFSRIQQFESLPHIVDEDYSVIKHMENVEKMRSVLNKVKDPSESMLTVNYLQKLGIDYHFKEEVKSMLCTLHENTYTKNSKKSFNDLFAVALSFRLLRLAGHLVSSEVFIKFVDKKQRFNTALQSDVQGLLSLHEASHLNTGEDMLDIAKEFSGRHLASCVEYLEPNDAEFVRHALKHPNHMTISRYNTRYYLDHGNNGALEDFARFDFNMVQSLHQKELKEILRWWESTHLAEDLKFARNQPLKWYLWPMTVIADPQFSKCRILLTKVVTFIYIIDDIFDIYGSPEDLDLFTDSINKWDLSSMDTLPPYMQSCYISLYDITNEIAEIIYKEQGWNPINTLTKSWKRLCNAFLVESKWFRSKHIPKHIPKSDEYLKNAVISSGFHIVTMHAFFLLGQGITMENVNFIDSIPPLISCPSTIHRLWNDLGSAKDKNQDGYDGSYVDCYMKEYPQYSTQQAREHVKQMISNYWQTLNKECFMHAHFAQDLMTSSLNSARMAEIMYTYEANQNLPILENYINVLLFKSL